MSKLQQRFAALGDTDKKTWWENYLKHESCFWGVSCAQVEQELKHWYRDNNLATYSQKQLLALAMHLFTQRQVEEKLAAVMLLEKYVCLFQPWQTLDSSFHVLWSRKLIHDWYICDAFCLRVLRKLLAKHGDDYAQHLASQHNAPYVWQARSAVVPFVGNTEPYQDLLYRTCGHLIKREERFAKTAVGWLLRELSRVDPDLVRDFLFKQRKYLTTEVINNALKYSSAFDKKVIKKTLRESSGIVTTP